MPVTMSPAAARDTMKDILQKAGADRACITDAMNALDTRNMSGSMNAGIDVLGGLFRSAKVDANFQKSSTNYKKYKQKRRMLATHRPVGDHAPVDS